MLQAIDGFRQLVDEGRACLQAGDYAGLRALIDRNFEARCRVFAVGVRDREKVRIAREQGAAAKLFRSGGAVIGVPQDEGDLDRLLERYRECGFAAIRPTLPTREGGSPA